MENQIDQMNPQQQDPAFTAQATPAQKKSGKLLLVLVVLVAIVLLGIALLGKKIGVNDDQTVPAQAEQQTQEDLSSIQAELDSTVFEGVSDGL